MALIRPVLLLALSFRTCYSIDQGNEQCVDCVANASASSDKDALAYLASIRRISIPSQALHRHRGKTFYTIVLTLSEDESVVQASRRYSEFALLKQELTLIPSDGKFPGKQIYDSLCKWWKSLQSYVEDRRLGLEAYLNRALQQISQTADTAKYLQAGILAAFMIKQSDDHADHDIGEPIAKDSECSTDRDGVRRVLLFGGTFDPPTGAHAALAKNALESNYLDCAWFGPSYHPEYKPDKSGFELRLGMLEAVKNAGELGPPSKVDITSAFEESYYIDQDLDDADSDALDLLQKQYPNTIFDTSFGADTLTNQKYPMWNWAADYLKLIAKGGGRMIVVGRSSVTDEELDSAKADLQKKLTDAGYPPLEFTSTPPLEGFSDLSSSSIRKAYCLHRNSGLNGVIQEMVNAGLLPAVGDYLAKHPELIEAYEKAC